MTRVMPTTSVLPATLARPVTSVLPVLPVLPVMPVMPVLPVMPVMPVMPVLPARPVMPLAPPPPPRGTTAATGPEESAAVLGVAPAPALWCWRHPRPRGAAGRCVGARTDLPVDRRKAKRLAHRIRAAARRHGLPREVRVSPLARCRDVGRWLARWGWRVAVDARLLELDFGAWDGRRWSEIAWDEVERWNADLLHRAPGGGESLDALAARVHAFAAEGGVRLVVGHGGWINALRAVAPGCARLASHDWPAPPRYAQCVVWPPEAAGRRLPR